MKWHPIETAAKIGDPTVLIFDPDLGVTDGWWDNTRDVWTDGLVDWTPTHWMPMPSPPRRGEQRGMDLRGVKATLPTKNALIAAAAVVQEDDYLQMTEERFCEEVERRVGGPVNRWMVGAWHVSLTLEHPQG